MSWPPIGEVSRLGRPWRDDRITKRAVVVGVHEAGPMKYRAPAVREDRPSPTSRDLALDREIDESAAGCSRKAVAEDRTAPRARADIASSDDATRRRLAGKVLRPKPKLLAPVGVNRARCANGVFGMATMHVAQRRNISRRISSRRAGDLGGSSVRPCHVRLGRELLRKQARQGAAEERPPHGTGRPARC